MKQSILDSSGHPKREKASEKITYTIRTSSPKYRLDNKSSAMRGSGMNELSTKDEHKQPKMRPSSNAVSRILKSYRICFIGENSSRQYRERRTWVSVIQKTTENKKYQIKENIRNYRFRFNNSHTILHFANKFKHK